MKIAKAILKLYREARRDGFRAAMHLAMKNVRVACWNYENSRFDSRYATDTGGSLERSELDIASASAEQGVRYEPTPVGIFRDIMSNLPGDLGAYTFVDFGSGKGRALLLASHYNFARIVGVEYAKDLHTIAVRNISSYRGTRQKCRDIVAHYGDACEFEIPAAPCVFYFCQPFAGNVLSKVLRNIEESIRIKPRKTFLIFLHPHPTLNRDEDLAFASPIKVKPLSFNLAWKHPRELEIWMTDC